MIARLAHGHALAATRRYRPASTGYGEPIQRLFKLKDGERVVDALSLDPRVIGNITPRKEGAVPPVHAVAVTSDGYSMRFGLEPFVEPSTRSGRRYAKAAAGAEFVGVARITGDEILIAATREGENAARMVAFRSRKLVQVHLRGSTPERQS